MYGRQLKEGKVLKQERTREERKGRKEKGTRKFTSKVPVSTGASSKHR